MIHEDTPESTVAEGKTVDEAVRKGLIASGWSKEQVAIEVLDPGSHGPWVNTAVARVRLSRRTADAIQLASEVTAGILRQVGLDGHARVERRPDHLHVMVEGEGLEAALVSGEGEGLDALQHVVSRIVSKRSGTRQLVSIDLGGFRERRERHLRDLAYQIADEVRQTGRKVLTEPMAAAERRVVHLALNEDPDITTFAIGDGLVKPIAIAPIDQAPPPEERRPGDRRFSGRRREGDWREGEGRGGEGRGGGRYRGGREGGRGSSGHGRMGERDSGGGPGGRREGGPRTGPGPGRDRPGYGGASRGPGGPRGRSQYPDRDRERGPNRPGAGERRPGEREGDRVRSDRGGARDSREAREPRDVRERDPRDRGPRESDPRERDSRERDARGPRWQGQPQGPRSHRDPRETAETGGARPRRDDYGDRSPRDEPRGEAARFLRDDDSWDPIGDGEFVDDVPIDEIEEETPIPPETPAVEPGQEQPRAERRPSRPWGGRGGRGGREGGRRR
jgi:spoIIIJ-associated protein